MVTVALHGTRRLVFRGREFLSNCHSLRQDKRLQLRLALLAAITVAVLGSPGANAFVTPAAGSFGYDVYNTVVNDILGGPIGFVGGIFLIVWGATQLMRNWIMTIACVIAGTVLIKAVTILTSLGALV